MEHPAFDDSNFCFCPPPGSFSAVPPPSFEGHPAVAVRRQRSEIPLIENVTAANRRHSLNARASRASGGFRFFAFTSSLLGCISLKTSILRVKVPFSPKTFYLPIVQQLRCEGNCLHLDGRGGLSAARQKRRRRMSLATAVRRVKARGENATPFAFTHNTLCDR